MYREASHNLGVGWSTWVPIYIKREQKQAENDGVCGEGPISTLCLPDDQINIGRSDVPPFSAPVVNLGSQKVFQSIPTIDLCIHADFRILTHS